VTLDQQSAESSRTSPPVAPALLATHPATVLPPRTRFGPAAAGRPGSFDSAKNTWPAKAVPVADAAAGVPSGRCLCALHRRRRAGHLRPMSLQDNVDLPDLCRQGAATCLWKKDHSVINLLQRGKSEKRISHSRMPFGFRKCYPANTCKHTYCGFVCGLASTRIWSCSINSQGIEIYNFPPR
jgi:hypothetical protein